MLVIGVDTGLTHTALAALDGGKATWRGTIAVEGDETGPRYAVLRQALERFVRRVNARPDFVGIEEPELGVREGHEIEHVLKLYGSFAVTFAELARLWPRATIRGILANRWKGTVAKKTTAGMMRAKYKIECRNAHEWDALGIADYSWDIARALRKNLTDSTESRV